MLNVENEFAAWDTRGTIEVMDIPLPSILFIRFHSLLKPPIIMKWRYPKGNTGE